MKRKNLNFTLLAIFLLPTLIYAQSAIQYTYDAAGNRIKREKTGGDFRKAAPGSEEKKETSIVSKNNLQASFTPNPTFTGNFTVVVNQSDFASADKNTSDKKSVGELTQPQVIVYNPLGELIHREFAQFNSPVYINLSKEAKGIYIVKIQCGEDVLMHRMAYQ